MENLTTLQNFNLRVSLDRATVIHANKYSRANGAISPIVFSSLHTDVVFRMHNSNKDVSIYVKNLDLPIYSGQEVILIVVANTIVGYIDAKSNHYYYITKDLGRRLGVGIPFYWVWLIAIIAAAVIFFIQRLTLSFWSFIPLIGAWLSILAQKLLLNYRIKRDLDRFLS